MRYIADRITIDPDVLGGKPAVRGHRISVQTVLEYLAAGEEPAEILFQFPFLEPEDLLACQAFAAQLIAEASQAHRWAEAV
jgi:uncharacterized protein (DUF433 family)